jgi:DNA-binding NtrC family response regulator
MAAVTQYDWPGNIREMKNVIEASMAMENADHLTLPVLAQFIEMPAEIHPASGEEPVEGDYSVAMARFEADYLKGLLARYSWNVDAAARDAGMNMATMYRKIKKYALRKD